MCDAAVEHEAHKGGEVVRGGKHAYVGARRRRDSSPSMGGAGRTFKSRVR